MVHSGGSLLSFPTEIAWKSYKKSSSSVFLPLKYAYSARSFFSFSSSAFCLESHSDFLLGRTTVARKTTWLRSGKGRPLDVARRRKLPLPNQSLVLLLHQLRLSPADFVVEIVGIAYGLFWVDEVAGTVAADFEYVQLVYCFLFCLAECTWSISGLLNFCESSSM